MNIGAEIRKVRVLKGYSQEYVADSLGISQKAYSHLENNKTNISIHRLSEIAVVLEVELIQFLVPDHWVLEEVPARKLNSVLSGFSLQLAQLRAEIKLLRSG